MVLPRYKVNAKISKLLKRPELTAELFFSSILIASYLLLGVLIAVVLEDKWQGLFIQESPAPDEWVYFMAYVLFALVSIWICTLTIMMTVKMYKLENSDAC